MPPLNPIKAAIAGAAFGAGVTMIVFGAVKGALDIINEQKTAAQPPQPEPAPAFVRESDAEDSDDYQV